MQPSNEIEAYGGLLGSHLNAMSRNLRELSLEHWDWTPDIAAPTARMLASHALQWLTCDRQHIVNADASAHTFVPDVPNDPSEICDRLDEESE